MNILILNWRDPKNPKSGGAEKLNMHILKPYLERGDSVIWYAMGALSLPKREEYNGITIIRHGNALTNLLLFPIFYWFGKFGEIDFIIDSIHGTGYLSSVFAPKVKKVILICEVAQNIWDEMYPFPINKIGKVWEKIMFLFYRKNKFWTISTSTKKDLIQFGIPAKDITVLPMGFDIVSLRTKPAKYKTPTALFVGRLAEMKGVKDAIQAIAEVNKNSSTKWTLNIIGRGEESYERELKDLVSKLKIIDSIHFFGYVEERKKFEEMAKAWVLLVPSSREGWGMIVPEANYVGTPAIGYDSPGLSEVLAKYSRSNKIIKRTSESISRELEKVIKPAMINEKITPTWEDLYDLIVKTKLL